jgi:hypothetical protein
MVAAAAPMAAVSVVQIEKRIVLDDQALKPFHADKEAES